MTFTKEQAESLTRLQIAMWLPAKCQECGDDYRNVDDFMARGVRRGLTEDFSFVDDACWERHERKTTKAKVDAAFPRKGRLADPKACKDCEACCSDCTYACIRLALKGHRCRAREEAHGNLDKEGA